MEITSENLQTLSEYLKHSLSPDVNTRRPGIITKAVCFVFSINGKIDEMHVIKVLICFSSCRNWIQFAYPLEKVISYLPYQILLNNHVQHNLQLSNEICI